MRSATLLTVGFSVSAILVGVACGSIEELPDGPETQQPEEQPKSTLPPSSTTTPDEEPPAPKKCVAKCASDSECANSCPAPTSGLSCCDVVTGTCYTNASNTCPKVKDPGTTPPAY